MNNTCPKCGTSYSIKAEHVGRKVTCKNCQTALIVGEGGLEVRSETGKFSSPSRPRVEEQPAAAPPEEAFAAAVAGGNGDDGDYNASSSRGRKKSGGMGDYLAFRKMIVPVIIQIIFWIFTILVLLGGLIYAGLSLISGKLEIILITVASACIIVPLYILAIRMYCEIIIVIFRMHDTLNNIYEELREQRR
jgi:predicted Zn finger-like uncharacterized protein